MENNTRLKKAIEIINYAITNKCSVRKASKDFGYGHGYVKNAKSDIISRYNNGFLDKQDYDDFFAVYNEYLLQNNTIKINDKKEDTKTKDNNHVASNKMTKKEENGNLNIEYSSNSSSYPKGHIKTLDQLLNACQVDKDKWNVLNYKVNKWDVTSWKNLKPETIQNFQVKATLEKNKEVFDTEKILE
ncbi:MAG: hypothetical protein ACOC2W_01395 [bacterium]